MSQMLKSSGALATATLTSRILGMVRESFTAQFMGDGPVAQRIQARVSDSNLFRACWGRAPCRRLLFRSSKTRKERRRTGDVAVGERRDFRDGGRAAAISSWVMLGIRWSWR